MPVPTIVKIEIIPQIWAYKKAWLDLCLSNTPPETDSPEDYAGNFFGIVDIDTIPKFKWWSLKTWDDEPTAFSIKLSDANAFADINLSLKVGDIIQWLSKYATNIYAGATKYVAPDENESKTWKILQPIDKGEEFVFPSWSEADNPSLNMPLRIRFLYKVTYIASDGLTEVIAQFPNTTATPYYEVVLNSDLPYGFEAKKEYMTSEIICFDSTGATVTITNNIAEPTDNPTYIAVITYILGNNNIMELENLRIALWNESVSEELRHLDESPDALILNFTSKEINKWSFYDKTPAQKYGKNSHLNPRNSFRRIELFQLNTATSKSDVFDAYMVENENTWNGINAVSPLTLNWDYDVPFIEKVTEQDVFNFYDTCAPIKLKIQNPNANYPFTDVSQTIKLTDVWINNNGTWVDLGDSDDIITTDIDNIAASGFGSISIDNITTTQVLTWLEASSYSAADIKAMQFTLTLSYAGKINAIDVLVPQTVIHYISMCMMKELAYFTVSLDGAQISMTNSNWINTQIKLMVSTSLFYANYKNNIRILSAVKITQNNYTSQVQAQIGEQNIYNYSFYPEILPSSAIQLYFATFTNIYPQRLNSGTAQFEMQIMDANRNLVRLRYNLPSIVLADSVYDLAVIPKASELDGISESMLRRL